MRSSTIVREKNLRVMAPPDKPNEDREGHLSGGITDQDLAQILRQSAETTERLLKENAELRAQLSAQGQVAGAVGGAYGELEARFKALQQENREFANRYVEIEEENNNLANLYVASYQLHSTLDFREVLQIVQEIVINLIGAEAFAILLLDEKTNELKTIAFEGEDVMAGLGQISTRLGEGVLGTVA